MTSIVGIIPARYQSSRFPGKPLIDIEGKPMIQRVYERASSCKSLSRVIVATDDKRISDTVQGFGGEVKMTRADHQNGTERCAEVAQELDADYIINIQGDEPYIHPEQISSLASILDGHTQLGTLVKKVEDITLLDNPNVMKVVIDHKRYAIYFSRSCVPYIRGHEKQDWLVEHRFWKHIGIYAYRKDILQEIVKLPTGVLERAESLEQLRWIEFGYRIKTASTDKDGISIDTPEDLERLKKYLEDGKIS